MFVDHAGLAFGMFHRYVYTPFRAGNLKRSAQHKAALTKAGAAAAAAAREVVLAKQAAQSSTALRKLYGPLAALVPSLSVLAIKLDHGRLDSGDLKTVHSQVLGIEQIGSAAGVKITERAQQLAAKR